MNNEADLEFKLKATVSQFKKNPTNRKLFFSEHKIDKLASHKNKRFFDRKDEALLRKIGSYFNQETENTAEQTHLSNTESELRSLTASICQLNSKMRRLAEKTSAFRRKIESLQLIFSKLAN